MSECKNSITEIRLIIYDFDGVMTDNKALLMDDGREAVLIHRGDGLAIARIKEMGIEQMILSTETHLIVSARAKKLGIPVFQAVMDKKAEVQRIIAERKISPDQIAFFGNDLNDEMTMRCVGWPIAPADACQTIKDIARVVLSRNGGDGVVREFLDLLLSRQK